MRFKPAKLVKLIVLLAVSILANGCVVGSVVQIKILKDEMKAMNKRVTTLESRLDSLQRVAGGKDTIKATQ